MIEWSNTNNWRKSQLVRFAFSIVLFGFTKVHASTATSSIYTFSQFFPANANYEIYDSAAGDAHSDAEFRVIEGTVALS